jgi:hypothetical protein
VSFHGRLDALPPGLVELLQLAPMDLDGYRLLERTVDQGVVTDQAADVEQERQVHRLPVLPSTFGMGSIGGALENVHLEGRALAPVRTLMGCLELNHTPEFDLVVHWGSVRMCRTVVVPSSLTWAI